MGIGHWALGIGHWALPRAGNWALGIGHWEEGLPRAEKHWPSQGIGLPRGLGIRNLEIGNC
ncbi:MAG: hypothetical protein EAZ19_02680 [Oscillatoriales cyanobacterium]|nr:hypothetical protein [Microcoleus sp. PH2017_35_SFW_U_B]TAE67926.1 MAG: hypothetical protein EAZ86_15235 [Oscillatoriales cyanobacterium]TAF95464.1 MAG: hypothetical protein EAZ45_25625 [Oscillatoriales cyanobacterium]TAG18340.1 MAG: hypothetical protein EAZ39_11755 [Oscillatoriales cyanobacterium]TAG46685.1 MAG: hypothetical protein EAZ33_05955 [Oscillatoriales cyanobacterium]